MLTIYLLPSPHDSATLRMITEAAARAFPGVPVQSLANVDEALLRAPRHGTVLLVLMEPNMAEVKMAVEAVNAEGLPRWAFVILGGEVQQGGSEVVPQEEWAAPLLRHVFRATVDQYELARENARFRGDLHTVGRRISHDLRTPLSGIFTTAELLNEILTEHSPEDAGLVTPLYDSTQAVLKLIDRVSFLAKATVEPKPKEPVAMGPVVWAARQSVERLLMKKGAQLTEMEDWPLVHGVTSWLEVVWANLLGNAVMHGGASPRVVAGWTDLGTEYQFWVRDDGSGIPEARRAALFQPFHRLHQSNSSHGLGLSIVQRLVDLQGGGCGYEAAPGGGASFFFTLPRESDSAAVPA
ncbi:MAG: HAMP domain-containing sensor histidine kinase [Prosthecobacter sp.]|nr:HAMP domain-containing sensor histidine kinase [Prosthecobacter sp.]